MRLAAPALIGADGVNSNVRKKILGDGDPLPAGAMIFRATIPAAEMPKALQQPYPTFWAGPGWHVIYYPLSDWSMFNLGCTVVTARPSSAKARMRPRRCCRISPARCAIPDRVCGFRKNSATTSSCIASRSRTGPWAGDAARRRRASDGAVHRPGRGDGAGGRDLPRRRGARMRRRFRESVPALPGHPHRANRAGADLVADDGPDQPRQGRGAKGAQFAVRGPHAGAVSTIAWRGSTPRRPM